MRKLLIVLFVLLIAGFSLFGYTNNTHDEVTTMKQEKIEAK